MRKTDRGQAVEMAATTLGSAATTTRNIRDFPSGIEDDPVGR